MRKIELVAGENPGMAAVEVKIRLGARCGISPEALKKEFSARLEQLEARVLPTPAEENVSPEILAVIAVAVTAFLGKKVKIRSARLTFQTTSWAQAGRATVQASHNLNR